VNLVDGGNTPTLDNTVQTAFPDEGLEVQEDLMVESPYLSDQVMKSTVEREDMMPNAMVRDVLVANPQSAKSQEVISTLEERTVPMPDYMMDQIMTGAEVVGAKEILERELSTYATSRSEAFQNLYLHYKNQGEDEDAQSALITLLEEENSVEAKYTLAFLYFDNQNTKQALTVLNSIPQQFDLDIQASETHTRYEQLLSVLINMKDNEISATCLDEGNAALLLQLAEDLNDMPGKYARSILITAGLYEYEELVLMPDPNGLKSALQTMILCKSRKNKRS